MTYFNKAQVESALVELETITKEKINEVSIQLMSPVSGDWGKGKPNDISR